MANEGHVNYDVSDVSVEAMGSRTTGSGCATVGTTSPKPRAQLIILAKDIPQGSISTKMVFDKIGEGGGGTVFRFASE